MIRIRELCVIKIIKLKVTFKAYDKDDDGKVSRMEFYEFIKESWICAFRLLAEIV